MGELLARMRVALRRAASPAAEPVYFGGLTVDLTTRLVTVGDREVQVTPTEYDLLRTLVAHAGKVLTHRQLLRQVWGVGYESEAHLLPRQHEQSAPQDSSRMPPGPRYILTEPGVGYRLRVTRDATEADHS